MNFSDCHTNLAAFDYRTFKKAHQEVTRDALNGWTAKESRFSPYSFEGGTVAAIAGDDFVVIAGDTRMSTNGAVVQTRHSEKVIKLDENIVLGAIGFQGDFRQMARVLHARMKVYQFTYNAPMTVHAAAEMLSRTLYYKRFFPYYLRNLLGGIDSAGKGVLYGYDPVGMIQREECGVAGAGTEILQAFLDNQVKWTNKPASTKPPMTVERAQQLLRDGFRAVAERETSTGDAVYLVTVCAGKPVAEQTVPLRGD